MTYDRALWSFVLFVGPLTIEIILKEQTSHQKFIFKNIKATKLVLAVIKQNFMYSKLRNNIMMLANLKNGASRMRKRLEIKESPNKMESRGDS